MKERTNRALAGAFAFSLICGSASIALADPGGNGHARGNANAHTMASPSVHGDSASHRENADDTNNAGTAHNCINPAGKTRGWCKSHVGGAFINGRVVAINGNMATIALSNGQTVTINDQFLSNQGRSLTVGQQVTLRGSWQNGVFVVDNGPYNNYGGPYSGASVRGLIISVNGNSIQIAQGLNLITINASNAAARGAINGSLFPGRTITASGNWNGSVFDATSIQ